MKYPRTSNTGYWITDDKGFYKFEQNLCVSLIAYLQKKKYSKVYDFGCGSCEYLEKLISVGFTCLGIEGNPYVKNFSKLTIVRDLAEPFLLNPWDCILCIDVAESIPSQYESIFIDNLTNNAGNSIVVSWKSKTKKNINLNYRDVNYISNEFSRRGFKLNATDTYALKNATNKEIYVFDRLIDFQNNSRTKDKDFS